ncbi:ATP-grasp fold amidoligase family protein [Cohnella sp.]|uniref:ATP-grasp fold amidoligase family protein n=1 Tax=Cohnella sp. TaxID=1883426 RepID=UPI003568FCF4
MNDEIHLQFMYWVRIGKRLNLNKPKSFNEKLQWLKLYDRNPIYTQLVDKYEVRRYITNVIGEKYLIPLLGVYNDFDEIDIEKLPEAFVLKCTHDSGGLLICKDKKSLDLEEAKVKFNRWLKRNFYFNSREWPYKNVEPRIICEEFKLDESSTELKDYKFMCFNGEAKCLFVCLNRNSPNGLNVDFYDMDWNPMPFERHYLNSKSIINKPKNFKKMVEFAEKLSKNIPFVRVDFYEINGNLFFGELTFYPGSGYEKFKPESFDYLLGSWIELPTKQF